MVTGQATQLDPKARHRLDIPEYLEAYYEAMGIDPHIRRSDDEFDRVVAEEEKAMAMQRAIEMAQGAASAAKDASDAKTSDGGNMLDTMRGVGAAV
jgi:hypothetical protein